MSKQDKDKIGKEAKGSRVSSKPSSAHKSNKPQTNAGAKVRNLPDRPKRQEEVKKVSKKVNDNITKVKKDAVKEKGLNKEQNTDLPSKSSSAIATVKKSLGIFLDIILYPMLVISILTSVISLTARDSREVKSLFSYSVVTILSGSMEKGGFDVGDVVFLKSVSVKELRPTVSSGTGDSKEVISQGDVIAFYKYTSGAPRKSTLTPVDDFDNFPQETVEESMFDKNIKNKAISAETQVVFHRIVGVYVAADGTVFFETQGDNNANTDGLIHEDLVLGKYVKAAGFITNALTYMITPDGMFWAIIMPLAFIVFFQIVELMTIIFDLATEKKVLEGTLPFDSEESIKANVGKEMMEYSKVYFYDITVPKDKERVKVFLWGHLQEGKITRKEAALRNKVEEALHLYQTSRDKYWEFWKGQFKGVRGRTKLEKLNKNANIIIRARELKIK